jgi:hypothetical protein
MHCLPAHLQLGVVVRVAVSVATAAALLLSSYVALRLFGRDDFEDIARAYPSPEMHWHVRELGLSDAELASKPGSESAPADFDGDGTLDELVFEYFHMEPLFSRPTSGMIRVISGRTHELLLAHAVDGPFSRVEWCGDLDGNGTDDLRIHDEGRWRALGYQRER